MLHARTVAMLSAFLQGVWEMARIEESSESFYWLWFRDMLKRLMNYGGPCCSGMPLVLSYECWAFLARIDVATVFCGIFIELT